MIRSVQCTNCSQFGHTSKNCSLPITSYGVLLFRWKGGVWPTVDLTPEFVESNLELFLVQRKDSIGYVEILRGKYKLAEKDYLIGLLGGTTLLERKRLLEQPFDMLWENLWGPPQDSGHSYKAEKEIARQKFEILRVELPSLLNGLSELWTTPEWGIPKGRKELYETEYACAMREFWEETNISEKDILPLRNLDPLREKFLGSNGVQYCHKYYVAWAPPGVGEESYLVSYAANPHMQREIGDTRWCSFKDALSLFRPEHKERQHLLQVLVMALTRVAIVPLAPRRVRSES